MKLHLVSFGTTHNYSGALSRFKLQTLQLNHLLGYDFATACVWDETHLVANHPEWVSQHRQFILANPRGFGYWIWKSFLIDDRLRNIPKDDVLAWVDVGCQFNFKAISRLQEYVALAHDSGFVCFDVGMPEHMWTKMDTASWLGVDKESTVMDSGQAIGTVSFWKNTPANQNLIQAWQDAATTNNYSLVNDQPSSLPNHPSFREHRHDQSILSCLVKKQNYGTILPDETYFGPNWAENGGASPIWATRNHTSNVI